MYGSSALPSTAKTLLTWLAFILLISYSEGIFCKQCFERDTCDICIGEKCLKIISPYGSIRRQCINGTDPAFDFMGHKHTDDGEDAYICNDRDFCNSSEISVFSSFLLASAVLLKIFI